MTPRQRARALFAIKFAVSASLVALLLAWVDTRAIGELFATADIGLLLFGAACLIGQTALSSLKWTVILQGQGAQPGFLELFRINLVSGFINLFAPGTLGGDAYRAVSVRRHTNGVVGALPSIILDRGSGVFALISIGVAGLTALLAPDRLALVLAAYALCVALGYALAIGPIAAFARRQSAKTFFGAFGVLDQILRALQPSPRIAVVVALSFLFQLNTVWICWLYSTAVRIDVGLSDLLVVVPAAYLVEMIPISINGVGVREGTLTILFDQMGLVPEHGLVLGLTISIMRYVAGIVGGLLLALDVLAPRRATG